MLENILIFLIKSLIRKIKKRSREKGKKSCRDIKKFVAETKKKSTPKSLKSDLDLKSLTILKKSHLERKKEPPIKIKKVSGIFKSSVILIIKIPPLPYKKLLDQKGSQSLKMLAILKSLTNLQKINFNLKTLTTIDLLK